MAAGRGEEVGDNGDVEEAVRTGASGRAGADARTRHGQSGQRRGATAARRRRGSGKATTGRGCGDAGGVGRPGRCVRADEARPGRRQGGVPAGEQWATEVRSDASRASNGGGGWSWRGTGAQVAGPGAHARQQVKPSSSRGGGRTSHGESARRAGARERGGEGALTVAVG
nr:paraneoplastic antigen Ma6E-like [Aegilops tauschii subsp. strangulata]